MKALTTTVPRYVYAVVMLIFGLFHFIGGSSMAGVVPSFIPGGVFWVYLTGAALIAAAVSIVIRNMDNLSTVLLAAMLTIFALLIHLRAAIGGDQMSMGQAFKDLGLACGALFLAASAGRSGPLYSTVPRYVFGAILAIFGLFHFMNAGGMAAAVPSFIPGGVFWVYLTGVALLAAAVSLFMGKMDKLAMILTAAMLLIFALTIHLPGAASGGEGAQASTGNFLKDLGLMATALMLAHNAKDKKMPIGEKETAAAA